MNVYYCVVITHHGRQAGVYIEAYSIKGAQNKAENMDTVAICIAIQLMAIGQEVA